MVSSNAIATDGLSPSQGFTLTSGNDYGASADLASLSTYNGAPANLLAFTGPGQDFVIANPAVPDSGGTLLLLTVAVAALVAGRSAMIKAGEERKLQPVRIRIRR